MHTTARECPKSNLPLQQQQAWISPRAIAVERYRRVWTSLLSIPLFCLGGSSIELPEKTKPCPVWLSRGLPPSLPPLHRLVLYPTPSLILGRFERRGRM